MGNKTFEPFRIFEKMKWTGDLVWRQEAACLCTSHSNTETTGRDPACRGILSVLIKKR